MKFAQNLGIAAVTAISVAVVGANPTQAAVINYDFIVNAISGDNPGQYYGSLSYDDSTLIKTGEETLGTNNGLTIGFNYLGNDYTERDDLDYDSFPVISFQDGKLSGLSYLVEDQFFISNNLEDPDVGGANFYSIVSADLTSATQVGSVTYSKVPEPMTVSGTLVAGTIGMWLKRKKKASTVAK
ncbi:PEP-CTERM sorting domain-containing protein [Halotia branconii]|uniref:PEP-CTERM sorting domain-containing protein n=1 Tax=Halotia branconii CENA392 TaxID=1539056 RepID=A0AAJ6NS20_9CYAN|nr:PEP-CTERM sorting domain-containing protein [Halotia branconii]WGV25353.1 PEP-CTERM sorting domain-containing protein [Halotia branconii CENA392]